MKTHPVSGASRPLSSAGNTPSAQNNTGWLRAELYPPVEDPVEITFGTSGVVEQTSETRKNLLIKHAKAFDFLKQHQHCATPERDECCQLCDVGSVISRAQLDQILDIYEDQLDVYDRQRKAIATLYGNGGTDANLAMAQKPFPEVKGVRGVFSGYFTKYEGYGGTFHSFFPNDMRETFAKLTPPDVQNLLFAYEARVDRISNILDEARSSRHQDSTEAFHMLTEDLSTLHEAVASDNQDPLLAGPGALIDVNVEEIARLRATAGVAGAASLEWQQAVPKDFSMYMNTPHRNHITHRAGVLKHLSAQRAIGQTVGASKRKRFQPGFDPVQLSRKHALNPGPGWPERISTLTNDVHPVFSRKNFVDCPQQVYDVLKPALRLASQLLFHRATSSYWHTAAFGKREICSLNALRGERSIRIKDDIPWSSDNARKFENHIRDIANHVRFHFNGVSPDTKIHGLCWAPCEHRRFVLPTDAVWVRYAKIHLAFDFYTTAVRLSQTQRPDPDMVLRFNFLFANTLMHEFAHFLEYAHNTDNQSKEPYLNDNGYAEAGFGYEQKVFGGRIDSINDRADCAYGLCLSDCELRDDLHNEPNTYWSVPMEFYIMIQQQEVWDDPDVLEDPCFFHIPRTGARSCGSMTLSLQLWADESEDRAIDIVDLDAITGFAHPEYLRDIDGKIKKSGALQLSSEDQKAVATAEQPEYGFVTDNEKYRATAEKQAADEAVLRRVRAGRIAKPERVEYVNRLKDTNRKHRKAAGTRAKERTASLKRAAEANAESLVSNSFSQRPSAARASASTNRFAALMITDE